MPPFVKTACPHCQKQVVLDLAELTDVHAVVRAAEVYKAVQPKKARDVRVTCEHCQKPFVAQLPEE
jgi:endogenous inhibitor of DNA gyrase (YacG/DUF329 family)